MATSASVSTIGLSARVESAALRLWSPDHIFLITFALGAPGGITLLAINLFRIHLLNKILLPAFIAVSTALLSVLLYTTVLPLMPPLERSLFLGFYLLLVGLSMSGYFASYTQKQIESFQSATPDSEIQHRGWLSGIGIALASFVAYLVIVFVIAVVIAMFAILFGVIPGHSNIVY